MKKEINLCMNCMGELDENGKCPNCENVDNDSYISSYLAPKTFLSNKYAVGRLISYCGESALYIGYDTVENRKVTIREYMPDALCTRERDEEIITVKPDKLPLYKTYLSEFIELHTTLMNCSNIQCIQKVLEVFSENNTAYAVMDYMGGISLKSYLANCGEILPWEQAKELFPPILTGLGMLHGLGIIHRGISPSTIFVTEKNELMLIGFSISAAHTSDSDIGYEVFGGYAPPEQYSSARRNGSWTDVYGISALLYRCLTGITPPTAPERLMNDTLTEPMLINREVPKNVSDVIMKGMALEPDDRISTINEFVDRLFEQPSPASDISAEIPIPAKRPTAGKGGAKNTASDYQKGVRVSKNSSKAKKKAQKDMIKFIVLASLIGISIIAFIVALAVTSSKGSNPSETENGTVAATNQSSLSTDAPKTELTEETQPVQTNPPAGSGETYMLPNFTNSMYTTVSGSSQYSYLIFIPTYDYSDEIKKGQIISQSIEAETLVSSGTELKVVVSMGPSTVTLPDYKDKKAADYVKELGELGIKYRTEEKESAAVKEGNVVKCNKNVGESVSIVNSEEIVVYVAIKPVETTPPETDPPETDPPETDPPETDPPVEDDTEPTEPDPNV